MAYTKSWPKIEDMLAREPVDGAVTFTQEEWHHMRSYFRGLHEKSKEELRPKKPRFDPN